MIAVPDPDWFNLLAGAIAGRKISVHTAPGAEPLAYCDSQRIYVPARICANHLDARNAVLAQSLLLSAGSLDAALIRSLVGRPVAARRYAWLEILRAIDHRHDQLPLAFIRHPAFAGRRRCTRNAVESLELALGKTATADAIPDFIGSVRPVATLRAALAREGIAALMRRRRDAPRSVSTQTPELTDEDAATEASVIVRLFESALAGAGPVSEWLKKLLGMRRSLGGRDTRASGGGGGDEAPIGRIERAWRRGVHAVEGTLPPQAPGFDHHEQGVECSYPEWDCVRRVYRDGWVRVSEIDPRRAEGASDVSKVLVAPERELQRQLSSLGLDFEMNRAQRDGSDLDVGRLIERAIEMRVGVSGLIDDVYRASRRTRRDLGVVVLADISGSTEEIGANGESLFHQHLRAACQMARTFDRLGDRIALYGFQSWGRHLVQFARIKGHEETWNAAVAGRIADLEPAGYTRTGAAIRHAHRLLRTSIRLPNRLLILITDGFSYDQDYEEHYAEADTRKALSEASAAGIACVVLCIGGGQTAERLTAVFGASNLLIVDDARQITCRIRRVCARALAAVSHRTFATSAMRNH
jgi:nitric oxide reductase activation protein